MEINLGLILASIINFIILLAILKHFFFNKVKTIIDEREAYINEQLDSAEEAAEKARMIAVNNQRELQMAKEKGKKITEEQKRKAELVYSEIVSDANNEAKIIMERAKVEIEREREKVEFGLKKEAIDLAIELSKKVIEQNINEEKNRELINEFISEVGN